MSKIHNNHTGTKEITCVLFKRLPSHSTDSNHDEVFWEVSHAKNQKQPPQHTRSAPVCIPSKPLYGRCNFLHLALTHLENKDSYVRMLFIDFSSAFNTIIPQQLINKLNLLGLNNSLCNWILDFLTGRPQSVRVGHNTSNTTTLSKGAPQGCVLSPLLFTLLTHDCTAKFSSNHIIKFADDTTVVGVISNNDETHYREEVAQLAEWCGANNLSLNVEKTKGVVLDFRRRNSTDHPPLTIDSSTVERVGSTKFLGVHITEDLTWTTNTMSLSKKAQQRLHFLRRLKRASLPPPILTTFYRGTIESVLNSCIAVWYGNCSAADRKTLQRTVNTAAKIIGAPLPSILDIFLARCSSKTNSIVKDPTHPSHSLFQLLPSGRRYRSNRARSTRLLNSFFPQAVRALNSDHPAPLWNPMQTPTSWNMECFTSLLYVCIYVAPGTCEARHFVPLYVPTCSGMTIKLNLTWLDLVIHWQMEVGTEIWVNLGRRRFGIIVLKAELKSTNRILT